MKKKIKVLILTSTYPPQHTGSGLLIDGINKRLEKDPSIEFLFKIYCLTTRKIPDSEEIPKNVIFVRTDLNNYFKFSGIKNFIIDSFKYDVLLVVTLVQPLILISSVLAILFKRKIILEHTLLEQNLPGMIRKIYKYLTYRYFFKYLKVYSTGLASQIKNYGFKGKVYNFGAQVDLERFYYDPENIAKRRKELGISYSGENCFTFVGALSYRKGIDRIFNLINNIHEEQDYFINIVGPETDYYKDISKKNSQLIEKLKKEGKLNIVLGKNNRVNDFLMCSNFFLFPTRNEGFGAVLIEAMASGCIPISARVEGVTDDFLNSQNSFHFDFSDKTFFDTFLRALNLSSIERKKLIKKCLEDVSYYSLERVSNDYKSMYCEVVNVKN